MFNLSHRGVIKDVADCDWDFNPDFIMSLTSPKDEWKRTGYSTWSKTGRKRCGLCGDFLEREVCEGYRDYIKDSFKREVFDEYIQKTCPDCHTPIENRNLVEEVKMNAEVTYSFEPEPDNIPDYSVVPKMQFLPCECLFEPDDVMIRWDLDQKKLQDDVSAGYFPHFDGRVFKNE